MDVEEWGVPSDVAWFSCWRWRQILGSDFLLMHKEAKKKKRSIHFTSPVHCIKNFFYWPHFAKKLPSQNKITAVPRAECWLRNCVHNYTIDHRMTRHLDSCHLRKWKIWQKTNRQKKTKKHKGDERGSLKLGLVKSGSGGGFTFVSPTQGPPKRLVVKTVKIGSKVKCKFKRFRLSLAWLRGGCLAVSH